MSLVPYNSKEVVINSKKFTIIAFRASDGLQILSKLTALCMQLGKGFTPIIENYVNGKKILDIKLKPNMVQDLLENLNNILLSDDFFPLAKRLTSRCLCEGKELSNDEYFDLIFSCSYEDLIKLIKEVISLNFLSQSSIKTFLEKMKLPTKKE